MLSFPELHGLMAIRVGADNPGGLSRLANPPGHLRDGTGTVACPMRGDRAGTHDTVTIRCQIEGKDAIEVDLWRTSKRSSSSDTQR